MLTRGRLVWAIVTVAAIAGAAGLYWFQPWRLFTSRSPVLAVGQ
jgi:hypothetical protein